jgi:hypothetical protein
VINEVRKTVRAETKTHLHLRQRLLLIYGATLVVAIVGSIVIFMFEHHAPGTQIHTIGDSFFWTTTQLLTVSSQLPNPISTGARILDIFLQVWAISAVATLAGSFGAFFHRRGLERDPMTLPVSSPEPGDQQH